MVVESTTLDDVVAIARQLSPRDRLRRIERLAADLAPALPPDPQPAPIPSPPTPDETAPNQATPPRLRRRVWPVRSPSNRPSGS